MTDPDEIIDGYRVTLHAYCGMSIPVDDFVEPHDTDYALKRARSVAAQYIRSQRRAGYAIAVLDSGAEYEILEPEDAVMVPDACGVLRIAPILARTAQCFECGNTVRVGDACDCTMTDDEYLDWSGEDDQ
jgi:hypothetical protein